MLLTRLPGNLENAEALIARRARAAQIKSQWVSLYQQCYQFAMPTRETFSWQTEGQQKNNILYDSTLQETTYTAANTLLALLFPPWTRWAELAPGGEIPEEAIGPDIIEGLQKATRTFFAFLNTSKSFLPAISEIALDLMVGTGQLDFDEGPSNQDPFKFSAQPSSAIEIEEGPDGTIENTYMLRKPKAGHLQRLFPGLQIFDLSAKTQEIVLDPAKKDVTEVEIVQCSLYNPDNGRYYGVVIELKEKQIIWRFDYGPSCPKIVARASKVAGETFGRGRVMRALSDAKTLDKMVEFTLRQAALQLAPPMTGVSDGVLNPYTASLTPNTIIPVASNDNGNPSLSPIELGGNFQLTEAMMENLRQNIRRAMLGPEPSEGAVRSATEIDVSDRNRLWAMGGEYTRIQAELLAPIIARGIFILQKKGIVAPFKVDGKEVAVKWTSPFAKSQAAEDLMALQEALVLSSAAGPEVMQLTVKVEKIPEYVFRLKGIPESLLRDEEEQKNLTQQVAQLMAAQQQQEQVAAQGGVDQPQVGQ